jgi:histone-lysine N-methyltransferase SETMAR
LSNFGPWNFRSQNRNFVKFYEFKLGRTAAQTERNINKVWDQGSVNESTVQRWFKKFRNGEFDLGDKKGRGRPSEIDDDKLRALVEADPRTTVRELADELGASETAVSEHLERMKKSKKLDKWVPRELGEKINKSLLRSVSYASFAQQK